MNLFVKNKKHLYISLLILNSMKFLRMPNKAQTLKQASKALNIEDKENIDPTY